MSKHGNDITDEREKRVEANYKERKKRGKLTAYERENRR